MTAVDGSNSDSQSVSITTEGQGAYLSLRFGPEGALYWYGNEIEDVTGGWLATACKPASGYTNATTPTIERNDSSIKFYIAQNSLTTGGGLCHTKNMIDLSPYSTLNVSMLQGWSGRKDLLVTTSLTAAWESAPARVRHAGLTETVISLNVSSMNAPYYVAIGLAYNNSQTAAKTPVGVLVDRIWLE